MPPFDPDADPRSPEAREILLVEYQKAQDSAEHQDNLVSSIAGLWLGSAVLIGFVLSGFTSNDLARHKVVLCLVILVGLSLTVLAFYWSARAEGLKRLKYGRCKRIEDLLGMKQHGLAGDAKEWRLWLYRLPLVLLAAVWIVLFVDVVRAQAASHAQNSKRPPLSSSLTTTSEAGTGGRASGS